MDKVYIRSVTKTVSENSRAHSYCMPYNQEISGPMLVSTSKIEKKWAKKTSNSSIDLLISRSDVWSMNTTLRVGQKNNSEGARKKYKKGKLTHRAVLRHAAPQAKNKLS